MANKHYNHQTTTKIDGNMSQPSKAGSKSVSVPMKCPDFPKSLGGPAGSWPGLKGAEVRSPYPDKEGLD